MLQLAQLGICTHMAQSTSATVYPHDTAQHRGGGGAKPVHSMFSVMKLGREKSRKGGDGYGNF